VKKLFEKFPPESTALQSIEFKKMLSTHEEAVKKQLLRIIKAQNQFIILIPIQNIRIV
jgi:hypothetical protein